MAKVRDDQKLTVLLVEDTASTYEHIKQLISSQVAAGSIFLQRYEPKENDSNGIEVLLTENKKPSLVFLDWDLSKYVPPVSRMSVTGACDESGIPLCLYHFEQTEKGKIETMKRWDQNLIMLQNCSSKNELARQIIAYSNGFRKIYNEIIPREDVLRNTVNKILLTPDVAEINIDQYLWSRFNPLQVANVDPGIRSTRLASSLGYWINNVLLQFPGPVVSLGAAASYLDILEADFKREEIEGLFKDAKYNGPFNEKAPYWWRRKLDEIIANSLLESDSQMISGFEFVKRKGIEVKRSQCFWGHEGSGYYCIVRQVPVCSNPEHSVNPSGWVPLGADLSRIEKQKYDELQAWMSI